MQYLDVLIRSDGSPYKLFGDTECTDHFKSPHSYAKVIVDQMNGSDIYGRFLNNKTGLTILDLGANVGLFSIYASPSASRIVSVEPTPQHVGILKKLTKNIPNIEIVQEALSYKNGPVTFYLSGYNTTVNSLFNHHNTGSIIVDGKTLKTLMDDHNLDMVDFCKIDIEGSEMLSITDKSISEVSGRIKTIFIEVHPTDSSLGENVKSIGNIFVRNGYSVEYIGGDTIIAHKL
jgi:hypothetical protein